MSNNLDVDLAIENVLNDEFAESQFRVIKPSVLEDQIQRAKIDFHEELAPPAICLEVVADGASSIAATLGNFSAVIGKAKSRKTFLITLFLAAAIKRGCVLEKINCLLPQNKRRVILFDTEQGRYHVQKVAKRVCRLAGIDNPEHFDVYSLRSYAPVERINIIEQVLRATTDTGFVVIDGVRDLVADINSPEQATDMASKLLKWTEERNIHICVVLHQNKGDNNARGHLGTEIVNKAETVISVTKQSDQTISAVEAEFSRKKDFTPFAFRINEHTLPEIVDVLMEKEEKEKSKLTPFDMDEATHKKVIKEMFQGQAELCYSDLLTQVGLALSRMSSSAGENKRKDFIRHYKNQGWVIHVRTEGKKSIYQHGLG